MPAAISSEKDARRFRTRLTVAPYDLGKTLSSGQAFRWTARGGVWEGIVRSRWVRLTEGEAGIDCQTVEPGEWNWLEDYLQTGVDLKRVLAAFPNDEPMQLAMNSCRGLRLLRQEPWECLASFILSSTKQIVQIQQIIRLLCERFGSPLKVPPGHEPAYSFPLPETLARVSESELRACKMGFRAPYLRAAAAAVATGELHLAALDTLGTARARERLLMLPGVGRKIADCVLLFAYGFQDAFPVDVWVARGLQELYFAGRKVSRSDLERFSQTHFGPFAGYAQQYLFHYMRTKPRNSGRRTNENP